jgi:hypothetical protein
MYLTNFENIFGFSKQQNAHRKTLKNLGKNKNFQILAKYPILEIKPGIT